MIVVCFFFALCASMNTEDPEIIYIKLISAFSGNTLDEFRLESTSEEDVKNKLKAKVNELNSSFIDKRATLWLDGIDIMKGGEIQVVVSPLILCGGRNPRLAHRVRNVNCFTER